jgi:hypothetical protein
VIDVKRTVASGHVGVAIILDQDTVHSPARERIIDRVPICNETIRGQLLPESFTEQLGEDKPIARSWQKRMRLHRSANQELLDTGQRVAFLPSCAARWPLA